MTQRLQNKRALVTAAGNGIGLASALAMAREGAEVWATDINQDALAQLARRQAEAWRLHARAGCAGHAGGASLRPGDRRAGRAVQLRRPRPRRQHPRMPGIRLGLRHGPERQVHAPHDPRLPAGHARTRRRFHHQHVLGRLQRQGRAQPLRLRRVQGRRDRPDQGGGRRLRGARHPLQRHLPGTIESPSLRDRIAAQAPGRHRRRDRARRLRGPPAHRPRRPRRKSRRWRSTWPATNPPSPPAPSRSSTAAGPTDAAAFLPQTSRTRLPAPFFYPILP